MPKAIHSRIYKGFMKRQYKRKKDKADHRDHKFKAAPLSQLPPVVDNRHLDSPIEDQGELGSYTAFASYGAFQFLEMQEERANLALDASPEEFSNVYTPTSKLFIYYNERMIEGNVGEDTGGEIRDVIKAIAKYGACPDSALPYDVQKFTHKPSPDCYKLAFAHKFTQYASIESLNDIKNTLARSMPVVFGIMVYESFESDAVAKTGLIPMPDLQKEQCQGGHAVCAIGYDDTKQCLIVRNSWGTDWGAQGYFYLPYEYVSNPDLSSDFWSVAK